MHGLQALPRVRLERLPRMADFALWATACETACWPAARSKPPIGLTAGPRSKTSSTPIRWPRWVRELMAERRNGPVAHPSFSAPASRLEERPAGSKQQAWWPKNPRALAGRLRRAQTFLRALGIEIAFGREGRAGTRIITIQRSKRPTQPISSSRPHRLHRLHRRATNGIQDKP